LKFARLAVGRAGRIAVFQNTETGYTQWPATFG